MFKLKNNLSLVWFCVIASIINFLLYHYPFFAFVFHNVDDKSLNGIIIIISLVIIMLVANFFTFYLFLFLSRIVGKWLLAITFVINAVCVYFINTYSVIIDESMMGNVFDTHYSEASSFFSIRMFLYVLIFGVAPAMWVIRSKITKEKPKRFFKSRLFPCCFYSFYLLPMLVTGFGLTNIQNSWEALLCPGHIP